MYVYVGLYRAEKVAPREGAWIETFFNLIVPIMEQSRTP